MKKACAARAKAVKAGASPAAWGFKEAVAQRHLDDVWDATQDLIEVVRGRTPRERPVEVTPPSPVKARGTRAKKERPADSPIMTADEVAEALGISVRQIQKLEKAGAFPIPRLPQVSRKPTYSRELVMRYARGELTLPALSGKGRGKR